MNFRQRALRLVRRIVGTQMLADILRDTQRSSSLSEGDNGAYQELWRSAAAEVIDLRRRVAELEQDRELAVAAYATLNRYGALALESAEHLRDIVRAQAAEATRSMTSLRIRTAHKLADASPDHLHPRGAAHDNTRSLAFVLACERILGSNISVLDLGCAGGGLVLDFVLRNHSAIGIEGSDYPLRHRRGEWTVIPDRLFTADLTKQFTIENNDSALATFSIITAWEVLEHIQESDLAVLLSNVSCHLAEGGIFVGSVAMYEDTIDDVKWHQTVRPREWWLQKFSSHGFEMTEPVPFAHTEFCRGSGNGMNDVDFALNPELGFHFTLMIQK